jgi:hypothetical protein
MKMFSEVTIWMRQEMARRETRERKAGQSLCDETISNFEPASDGVENGKLLVLTRYWRVYLLRAGM